MRPSKCARCQGTMAQGFVIDSGRAVSAWIEGAPIRNLLVGVKIHGKTKYEIQTWRCSRCGFLESYAV